MPRTLNFSLSSQLGMQILGDLVVAKVNAGGQAEGLGIKDGWTIVSVKEGDQIHPVKCLDELQAVLAAIKANGNGHPFCALTFRENAPRPRPQDRAAAATSSSNTTQNGGLTPEVRSGAIAAGAWFFLKLIVGHEINEWLGGVLAFSFCAVVASTIGFDAAFFFSGGVSLLLFMRLLEVVFGKMMYDVIVLGLIAAFHTKPAPSSFDGRPMKEMMATRQAIRKQMKEASRPPRSTSGLDGFIGKSVSSRQRSSFGWGALFCTIGATSTDKFSVV